MSYNSIVCFITKIQNNNDSECNTKQLMKYVLKYTNNEEMPKITVLKNNQQHGRA